MSGLYAIIEYSVCMKKEIFAGLNHDYSYVSELFLTAKKVAEICCCFSPFFCLSGFGQFQFQLYFFSQNSGGLTLALMGPKEF